MRFSEVQAPARSIHDPLRNIVAADSRCVGVGAFEFA